MITLKKIERVFAVSAFLTALAVSPPVFAAYGSGPSLPGTASGTSTTSKETTTQYTDDATITAKVKTEMIADPDLKARDINVETTQGIVKLTGTVGTQAEKNKTMDFVRKIRGVKSVKDNLQVRQTSMPAQ